MRMLWDLEFYHRNIFGSYKPLSTGNPSYGDHLLEHLAPNLLSQGTSCAQIHFSAEALLKELSEGHQIEEICLFLEFDDKVNVTGGILLASDE